MVCEEKSAFNLIIGFLFCFIGDFFFLTVSRIFSLSLIFNIFYYNLFLNLSSFILIQVLVELTDLLFEVLYEISEVSGSQFFFFSVFSLFWHSYCTSIGILNGKGI